MSAILKSVLFKTVLYIPRLRPAVYTHIHYRTWFLDYIEDFTSSLVSVLRKLITAISYLKNNNRKYCGFPHIPTKILFIPIFLPFIIMSIRSEWKIIMKYKQCGRFYPLS